MPATLSRTRTKQKAAAPAVSAPRANARGRATDNPTRARILRIAGSLFLTNGYAATGIDQISKLAGVAPPSIYWHFQSKEAMLAEFMQATVTKLREAVYPRITAEDPPERLRQCIEAHVIFVLQWYALHDAHAASSGFGPLFGALAARRRKSIAATIDEYVYKLQSILEDGVRRGEFAIADISITTMAMVSMADHVFTWFNASGASSIEEVAQKYAHLALEMVRAR